MYKSFQDPVIGPMLLKKKDGLARKGGGFGSEQVPQNDHEAAVLRRECQPAEALGLQDREALWTEP